jgi:3-deoxy-D-manno-octulosonic-acid transferase
MYNFAAISELLLKEDAARVVVNSEELAEVITLWLEDASERTRVGENGRRVVQENQGAVDRLLGLIEQRL